MANEKRLIDANSEWMNDRININFGSVTRFIIKSILKDAPTVDAIVPPIKIGQVLWCILPHSEIPLECRVYCICREERNGLVLDYFRCAVKGWFGKAFSFEDVGKTVFPTKAEALAKMDGGNNEICIQDDI